MLAWEVQVKGWDWDCEQGQEFDILFNFMRNRFYSMV